jgi:hypothetical protein
MLTITKDTDIRAIKKPKEVKHKRKLDEFEENNENIELLQMAEQYWDALISFRLKAMRTFNYRMGLQWEDEVTDPDTGETITESELIMRNGKVPLKQNIIGQLANSFLGQYRSNPSKPIVITRTRDRQKEGEMMSAALEALLQANMADDLDVQSVNEFITSGFPIQKLIWGYDNTRDRKDILFRNPNINNIFFNTDLADIRGKDLTIIGERIECYLEDIIATFAKTKDQEKDIREIYATTFHEDIYSPGAQGKERYDNVSFLYPSELNKVMLFEIWRLEGRWMNSVHDWADATDTTTDLTDKELQSENDKRLKIGLSQGMNEEEIPLLEWEPIFERVWRVKYLSPWGHCFAEMDSPYLHQEHPYVFHAYPLLNGEIWGFLSEFIDQQRYINRLISLWDFVISASVKGLLMMPLEMVPKDVSPEEFAAEYRKFNGVLFYVSKPGVERPHQLAANSTNVGVQEMLSLQLKLINDISGIQGAMQGQQPHSGTPASMYALQSQNSSINVLDKMKHFDSFIQKRNFKTLKLMKQFYTEPRYSSIVGSSYDEEAKWFDPARIKDLEFDTTISKGKDAPAFRMMMDDLLLQLLQGQYIDVEMYLQNTSAPFADKLLEQIKQRKEMAMQGQNPGQIPPELMQTLGSNPQALEMINNLNTQRNE